MDGSPTLTREETLALDLLRVRLGQLVVNEKLKRKAFPVPVHLALGHEAVAVAVSRAMGGDDALCLSHRNIHYNLARAEDLRGEIAELALAPEGVSGGRFGSMNMRNPARGIPYTSSILGNDLAVAAGVALADRLSGARAVTFVVTGDGAMEEGVFYETVQALKSFELPSVIVVENNGWSLASRIHERRCPIDLSSLARAFDAPFRHLEGNDVVTYAETFDVVRAEALEGQGPVVVEVGLLTLGDWRGDPTPAEPDGKFINYHHGPARTVELSTWPVIHEDARDPVHVLTGRLSESWLRAQAGRLHEDLLKEAGA